ncbi:MAG: hypothetical protein J6Y69_11385 [Treponema sp.]|nr:hypothetical protein [Treponema sp.]
MKKILSAVITVFSIAILFLAVSCHDPIFYMISQEVVQEEGLQGDINSMVRFGDNLYISNGRIYKKTAESSTSTGLYNGQWTESSTSGIEGFVFFLATDTSYIYALSFQFTADNDKSLNLANNISLYASTDAQTWTEVDLSSFEQGAARIFDNGSNAAYIGIKTPTNNEGTEYTSTVYKLNGTSTPTTCSAPGDSLGAAGDQFWKTPAICYANGKYYFSYNSKTLYYWNNTSDYDNESLRDSIAHVELDCDDIQSIAATSDYLLLGTTKGIARVKLNASGEPEATTTDFANNAQSLVTGIVPMVFVLDPTQPEGQTDEYASMTIGGSLSSSQDTFTETGLYAYYPTRSVWNRDGN